MQRHPVLLWEDISHAFQPAEGPSWRGGEHRTLNQVWVCGYYGDLDILHYGTENAFVLLKWTWYYLRIILKKSWDNLNCSPGAKEFLHWLNFKIWWGKKLLYNFSPWVLLIQNIGHMNIIIFKKEKRKESINALSHHIGISIRSS